ncbi:hypothetical protein RRG08_039394 [Elysia crispata]|uniref:Uncharacterized protein n=1 Tax=Elysia crispata TaxID=231223 RepID=A0AAE1CMN4_9GAST|nr:hypothetical protein RRG08_039394 [Elysia crispata]
MGLGSSYGGLTGLKSSLKSLIKGNVAAASIFHASMRLMDRRGEKTFFQATAMEAEKHKNNELFLFSPKVSEHESDTPVTGCVCPPHLSPISTPAPASFVLQVSGWITFLVAEPRQANPPLGVSALVTSLVPIPPPLSAGPRQLLSRVYTRASGSLGI